MRLRFLILPNALCFSAPPARFFGKTRGHTREPSRGPFLLFTQLPPPKRCNFLSMLTPFFLLVWCTLRTGTPLHPSFFFDRLRRYTLLRTRVNRVSYAAPRAKIFSSDLPTATLVPQSLTRDWPFFLALLREVLPGCRCRKVLAGLSVWFFFLTRRGLFTNMIGFSFTPWVVENFLSCPFVREPDDYGSRPFLRSFWV